MTDWQSGGPPRKSSAEKGRELWKPGHSSKMKAGLMGLSSAAIVSVYAAGYVHTDASNPSGELAIAQAATATPARTTTTVSGGTAPRATSTTAPMGTPAARATSTPTTSAGTTAAYADGTYVGVGSSRHGSIQATVVVEGGKIVSAEITGCATKYPCSKVASLPAQVIARQSASVNYVSGATDSSKAYAGAVAQALAQAKV